jgi:hypothetical protein
MLVAHIFGIPVEESLPVALPLAGAFATSVTALRYRAIRRMRRRRE